MATRTGRGAPAALLERGTVLHGEAAVDYDVTRSARRRRTLELTVDGQGVHVAAPVRTPRSEIEDFVRGRLPWILRHRPTARPPLAFVTGETLPVQGAPLSLWVAPGGRRVSITRGLFDLHIAVPARLQEPQRARAIEAAVTRWYAARALEAIEASVSRWSAVTGLVPRRVLVRNQRQRWGSCAPDGTLRFNWRLAMLTPALLDYVVVHEMVHLAVPNHGAGFWRAVARLLPDHVDQRRALHEAAANLPAL